MAHKEQLDFCLKVKAKFPMHFSNKRVLDIGSLDINGNNSMLFTNSAYCGIDIGIGKNVNIVSKGHEFNAKDGSFDTIISTECFEHDQFYDKTINNAVRMLSAGGLFLFTCATTGRPEHGTRRTEQGSAPLLKAHGEWADYYKNLTEEDMRNVLDFDKHFCKYDFSTDNKSCDLYFWGIKR